MANGKTAKAQPYAYAKRGSDGKWYHWTALAGKVAQGMAMAGGFALAKWLLSDFSLTGLTGLTESLIDDVRELFK